jgi:hypothetical protein
MINAAKSSFVVVTLICLVSVIPMPAQNNDGCQPVRLLLQANLNLAGPHPGWSGVVRGFLNNTIPMNGILYVIDSQPTTATGQAGHEVGALVFDFGPKGRFVTNVSSMNFQVSPSVTPHMIYPPEVAFGRHIATLKVAPRTGLSSGWFTNATGNISSVGLWMVNAPPPFDMGFWNAEIDGRICNVTQQ